MSSIDSPSDSTWDIVVAVTAVVALVQPWIIGFVHRFLRKPKIDCFSTGNFEIGFANFGPSCAIQGTIRAVHGDVFVRDISLKITRARDRAEHRFVWGAFRPTRVALGSQSDITMEMPAGFLVTPVQPHRFNIFFADGDTFNEARPVLSSVRDQWQQLVFSILQQGLTGEAAQAEAGRRVEAFLQAHHEEWAKLVSLLYWSAGNHTCELYVRTSRPDQLITALKGEFSLTEADAARLKLNVVTLLRGVCDLPTQFNFAYATPTITLPDD